MHRVGERPAAAVRRLLTALIIEPASVTRLSPGELDLTLRLARRVRLLGRLAAKLEQQHGLIDSLPASAVEQLTSAAVAVEARYRITRWEVDRIAWVLNRDLRTPLIALKGCAYMLAALPNAAGRLFADVDLLVAERDLANVERTLVANGWEGRRLSPYDEHYYRAWTHELPPMIHVEREVELDLHHNILPRMARLKPRAELLLEAAQPIAEGRFCTLADPDLVLHAMTHLMFDSAMADCLRDLVDIDDLLRHFTANNRRFWDDLWSRAEALDLKRPAFYALRYANRLLRTKVPDEILLRSASGGPPAPVVWLMDRLVPRALFPLHPDRPSGSAEIARLLLYVRSLWIRMPPLLLARHLVFKFYVRKIRRAPPVESPVPKTRG